MHQSDGYRSISEGKRNAKKKDKPNKNTAELCKGPCQMPSEVFPNAKSETPKVQIVRTRRLFRAETKITRKGDAKYASFQRKP